jgi:hypothetical protein
MDASQQAADIVAALVEGSAEERQAAYGTLETAVRGALTTSGSRKDDAVALAVACVKPLVESVLCAPAARVGEAEWVRASLLLYEMCKADNLLVCAELWRKNDTGDLLIFTIWSAPETAFAAMLAKEHWTRDDAVLAAAHYSWVLPPLAGSPHQICSIAGVGEIEWVIAMVATNPIIGANPQPEDRFIPLALLMIDLVRSEVDKQPEGIIGGVGIFWLWASPARPSMGKALWEAGFLVRARARALSLSLSLARARALAPD